MRTMYFALAASMQHTFLLVTLLKDLKSGKVKSYFQQRKSFHSGKTVHEQLII